MHNNCVLLLLFITVVPFFLSAFVYLSMCADFYCFADYELYEVWKRNLENKLINGIVCGANNTIYCLAVSLCTDSSRWRAFDPLQLWFSSYSCSLLLCIVIHCSFNFDSISFFPHLGYFVCIGTTAAAATVAAASSAATASRFLFFAWIILHVRICCCCCCCE